MNCHVCGKEIIDYNHIISIGMNPPKKCEECRRKLRDYRPSSPDVRRECVGEYTVLLDASFSDALRLEHRPVWLDGQARNEEKFANRTGKDFIYSIGGRDFGPWGGATHGGKFLVHSFAQIGSGRIVNIRIMRKFAGGGEWTYLVFSPANDEKTALSLHLRFTRVFKSTLKGLGQQFNRHYPIECSHQAIFSGYSSARSGRFGNEWCVYITHE